MGDVTPAHRRGPAHDLGGNMATRDSTAAKKHPPWYEQYYNEVWHLEDAVQLVLGHLPAPPYAPARHVQGVNISRRRVQQTGKRDYGGMMVYSAHSIKNWDCDREFASSPVAPPPPTVSVSTFRLFRLLSCLGRDQSHYGYSREP